MLAGPPCPEEMLHLVNWTYQLHGRSGVGFGMLAPLSHQEIEAWARLSEIDLEPHEVRALIRLDDALLYPPAVDTSDERQDEGEEVAWPVRKALPRFVEED